MGRLWKIAIVASLAALVSATSARRMEAVQNTATVPMFDGSLSILTYNVKGLPWPIALGRDTALETIAARLRALRARREAPQIIVLQEAFTPEAQSIGAAAGYRYVADGPTADDAGSHRMSDADRRFASGAHWWKGETQRKYVGSGLQILSDYPIIAVRRVAFPTFACAGFDCLANKGAMLVTLRIAGVTTPVDILTTHLNSRRASHVDDARSIYAYRRQVAVLTDFVHKAHDLRYPLIAAGDFNVGSARPRRQALLGDVQARWAPATPVRDALNQFRDQGGALIPDAAYSLKRARDWQFYADGVANRLILTGIDVPFGHEASGGMLSDHVGYSARFRIEPSDIQTPEGALTKLEKGKA